MRSLSAIPDLRRARIHAAIACSFCQDFDRAERLLKPWRQWLPLDDDAMQLELSNEALLLGYGQEAQVVVEELLSRAPGNAAARLRLATLFERINRVDDAEALIRGVAADFPHMDPPMLRATEHALAAIAMRRREPGKAKELLLDAGPNEPSGLAGQPGVDGHEIEHPTDGVGAPNCRRRGQFRRELVCLFERYASKIT